MEISSVRVFPHEGNKDDLLKATATVVFNESLMVRSMRIVANRSNPSVLSVLYPESLTMDGFRHGCCYPKKDSPLRKEVSKRVLDQYRKSVTDPENTFWENPDYGGKKEFDLTAINLYLRFDPTGRNLAKVHVLLDDAFWLRFMQLIKRPDGSLWLNMPKLRMPNEKVIQLYHPLTAECRAQLMNAVLQEYEVAVQEQLSRRRKNLATGPSVSMAYSPVGQA